jgi:hypothetical protein
MYDWTSLLTSNPIEWLLEKENPSVRYFALKQLLDRTEDDSEVQDAKDSMMHTGLIPDILQRQQDPEYVKNHSRFYTAKYKGLVWSLIVLAELGSEAAAPIKNQCEYLLDASQARDGGFSMNNAVKSGGGRIREVIPCLTGNMVWCLIRFGYLDDPRLQNGINWLTRYMRFNDGIEVDPQEPPYDLHEICWGAHTCHMAVVKAMKGFSAIPQESRSPAVNDTVHKAVEFMLNHHVYKKSHNLNRVSKPGWKKFGFPLMYQTDVLEVLDILSDLRVKDYRLHDALDLVVSKQDSQGRWHLENTYNSDRLLIPMGRKDEPSKWLTLRAMRVLKYQYGTN